MSNVTHTQKKIMFKLSEYARGFLNKGPKDVPDSKETRVKDLFHQVQGLRRLPDLSA